MITYKDFEKVDIRVGAITEVSPLEDGKYSTHVLKIYLGSDLGTKQSCARLPSYKDSELVGRSVLCVVNFEPKQIGKYISEVLTLGVPDGDGECLLAKVDGKPPLGGRLY